MTPTRVNPHLILIGHSDSLNLFELMWFGEDLHSECIRLNSLGFDNFLYVLKIVLNLFFPVFMLFQLVVIIVSRLWS